MGGAGSTRWGDYQKKRTVEDTMSISVHAVQPYIVGAKRAGQSVSGRLRLTVGGQATEAAIRATFTVRRDDLAMRLQYGIGDDPGREFDYWIALECKASNLVPNVIGRCYFVCPECEHRSTMLYLPPDASFFACRTCHDLTYRSSQEQHKYDTLLRVTARELGLDEERTRRAVYAVLRSK